MTADVNEPRKFEAYPLSNEACEYMREMMKYRQEGDMFFIGIVRDENNARTLYNAAEFPPEYSDLKDRLYLLRVEQYSKPLPEYEKRQRESLDFIIPRRIYPPVQMIWLDEAK